MGGVYGTNVTFVDKAQWHVVTPGWSFKQITAQLQHYDIFTPPFWGIENKWKISVEKICITY